MPATLRVLMNESARRILSEHCEQTRQAESRLCYQMVLLAAGGLYITWIRRRRLPWWPGLLRQARGSGSGSVRSPRKPDR
jgi:hypothetical protein